MSQQAPEVADVLGLAREQVLERGEGLDQDQILQVLQLPDDQLEELLALAHEVRMRWCGPEVEVEGIISLKTGGCPEDCHFCSQSGLFASPVRSAWLDIPSLVEAAKQTAKSGATEFCIVAAVRGPDERLLAQVAAGIEAIRNEVDIQIACSLGMLTKEQVERLSAMGVHRYNHNLETARSFFTNVVTTHTWEERWETLAMVREAGMEVCCGGILGMGETLEQRAEFAANLAELDPHEVPLNFLNPRPGHAVRRPRGAARGGGAQGRRRVPVGLAAHHVAVRGRPGDHPRRPRRQAGHPRWHQRRHRRQLPDHAGPPRRGRPRVAQRSADAHQGAERDHLVAPTFNVYTGEPAGGEVPAAARLGLEPPRFCAECGRRMIVQVRPDGWEAKCSRHGVQDSKDLEEQR